MPGYVERIVEREWAERALKVDIGLHFLLSGTVERVMLDFDADEVTEQFSMEVR